jgi:hypothetical protein
VAGLRAFAEPEVDLVFGEAPVAIVHAHSTAAERAGAFEMARPLGLRCRRYFCNHDPLSFKFGRPDVCPHRRFQLVGA